MGYIPQKVFMCVTREGGVSHKMYSYVFTWMRYVAQYVFICVTHEWGMSHKMYSYVLHVIEVCPIVWSCWYQVRRECHTTHTHTHAHTHLHTLTRKHESGFNMFDLPHSYVRHKCDICVWYIHMLHAFVVFDAWKTHVPKHKTDDVRLIMNFSKKIKPHNIT